MRTIILTLFLTLTVPGLCLAETVYISVAASMTDAMKEMIHSFSAQHNKGRILANFASSGALAKQINQGAPSHLYISANPKWMDYLVENEAVVPATKIIFAYNSLVFIAEKPERIRKLDHLKDLNRIGIGNPASVPAGQYAKQAMEATGIYDDLKSRNILVMAKDVRQALLYADRGEVDGAFVYKTDARLAQHATIAFEVPTKLYNRVAYPVALTSQGEKSELTRNFMSFLTGEQGAKILTKYGFEAVK